MSQTNRDPVAERLADQLDSDRSPDTAQGQVFFSLGYLKEDVDPEVEEALDLVADKLKEV